MDILKINQKIISVLFIINFLFLLLSIFFLTKWVTIVFCVINIVLIGTNLIITKYSYLFLSLSSTNKIMGKLNDSLSKLE